MDELLEIVGAMRSLAGMRMQEAQRALPGIRRYADSMAAAIAGALLLLDAPAPALVGERGGRAIVAVRLRARFRRRVQRAADRRGGGGARSVGRTARARQSRRSAGRRARSQRRTGRTRSRPMSPAPPARPMRSRRSSTAESRAATSAGSKSSSSATARANRRRSSAGRCCRSIRRRCRRRSGARRRCTI